MNGIKYQDFHLIKFVVMLYFINIFSNEKEILVIFRKLLFQYHLRVLLLKDKDLSLE